MADNVLKARIVLEAPGVAAVTNAATAAVKKLKDSLAGIKGSADLASFSIGKVGTTLRAVRNPAAEAAAALDKTKLGANQAGNALQNLGRIAQDAPFGFIGISNNINPLLESFQRLKASTGTTGGALKALASQLGGAGGLGLAVSVVTGLLTVFSKEIFGSGSAADAAKSSMDRYQDAVDNLKESVEGVSRAIAFANQLGSINVKIAGFGKDTGTELQDLREQSVAQQTAIENATAYVKGLSAIRDEAQKDLKIDSKEYKDIDLQFYKDQREGYLKLEEEANKSRIIYRQIAFQKLQDQQEVNDKAKAARDKDLENNDKYVSDIIKQAKQLAERLQATTVRNVRFDTNSYDSVLEQYRKAVTFLNKADGPQYVVNFKLKPDFLSGDEGLRKAVDFFSRINFKPVIDTKTTEEINKEIEKTISDQSKRNPILIQMSAALQGFYDFEEKMRRAAEDLARTVQGAFQNAFVGLAQGIGEAIGGEDIGKALFSVIGDLITQIGKALIQYGIVKAGLDKILSAGGIAIPGGAAIALGAFAIAIGGLIKNTRVKGQRALGGSVTGGSPYLVGERGQEVFVPNTSGRIVPNSALGGSVSGRGAQQIYGQFRIAGNDLIAVVANTSRSQRRLS